MDNSEQVLGEFQKVIGEFEDLIKATVGAAGDKAGNAAEQLQAGLDRARDRLNTFERSAGGEFRQGARAADRYVHDNAWAAVGVAAAVAFLLGVMASRRN